MNATSRTNRSARPLTTRAALLAGVALIGLATAHAQQEPIDWKRAQTLHQRAQRGEKLSAEEQAYYDRAREARSRGAANNNAAGTRADRRPTGPVPPARESTGLVPLTELGEKLYQGEDGGLYGGGKNTPPNDHLASIERELAQVVPRDDEGNPAPNGKIVLISIGMSNTTQEFSRFKQLADADPRKSSHLVIVDGAQGGRTASAWAEAEATPRDPWPTLAERLERARVTPAQVQLAWIKHAEAVPSQQGEFPKHARILADNITKTLHLLRERYPNVRVAYLTSRIYAGYASTPLNPEPYAYESAFANRWVIQEQMAGESKLNFDSGKGKVIAPAVVWGPYLWADGVKPRASDGLTWVRGDLVGDGTHPSPESGRQKVAELLLRFVHEDPLAEGWYLGKVATDDK